MDTISTFHTAGDDKWSAAAGDAPSSRRKAATAAEVRDTAASGRAATGKIGTSAGRKGKGRASKATKGTAATSLMPDNIETDPKVLDFIRTRPTAPMTADQMKAQCVSFVYGNMPQSSTLSREDVEALLSRTGPTYP